MRPREFMAGCSLFVFVKAREEPAPASLSVQEIACTLRASTRNNLPGGLRLLDSSWGLLRKRLKKFNPTEPLNRGCNSVFQATYSITHCP